MSQERQGRVSTPLRSPFWTCSKRRFVNKNKEIPLGAINEVMDNFFSISILASTMDILKDSEFDKSSATSKEDVALKARMKLLEDERKKAIILPFFLGGVDFLLQQVDMQHEENYQNIAHSVATDVFSKIFGVSHKSADEFITEGFEINCSEKG